MTIRIYLLTLLMIVTLACKNKVPVSSEEHDHETEEIRLKLTAYSNTLEVFAEAEPFVSGKSSEILAHFSFLKNFKPIEKGSITARFQVGSSTTEQTLEEPSRKGIYKFNLTPTQSGKGQLTFSVKTDSGKYEIEVPNIEVFGGLEQAIHEAEKHDVSKTNTVVFTKEQSWKIDFATELPLCEPFGQVIKTAARIEPSPDDEEIVTAKTSGIVRLIGQNLLPGKSLSVGQPLFIISGDQLAENNSSIRFAEASNNYEKAKADFERLTELAKDQIVSQKDLLESKTKYENAKAVYSNMKTNFSSIGQSVKSPRNGFIQKVFVSNGEFAEAGQKLLSLAGNRSLILRADVPQKYASVLGLVTSATIRTPGQEKIYTLEELNGKIVTIGRSTNENNFMIPICLQIENTADFIAGSFAEVSLKTTGSSPVLAIPNAALMEEQGHYFVFVQINPELFEKREIKPGATDGLKTEILSGIGAADRIVTKGAILIKLAQSSGALDAHSGHVH